MKRMITATLAAMMMTASATALAAAVRDGERPQEYAPYPETSYACCCGGEPSGEQKPQGNS